MLKTTNGGNNWNSVTILNNNYKLKTIFFLGSTGWAGGWKDSQTGVVLKTTNTGASWIEQTQSFWRPTNNIVMVNPQIGFLTQDNMDSVFATTNGGESWIGRKAGNMQPVVRLFFLNSVTGWALGSVGYISKTTNGGITWEMFTHPTGNRNNTNLFFTNLLTGWIITSGGGIMKTTNSGENWLTQRAGLSGSNNYESFAFDVYFKNDNSGWVTCGNGQLLKTTNGGSNWLEQINPPLGKIKEIEFLNENQGYLLSNYSNLYDQSFIYKTNDRGYSWSQIFTRTNSTINAIDFADINTGFACGQFGTLFKTTNSGENWLDLNFNDSLQFNDITFSGLDTGFLCGRNGKIFKTVNGGINWVLKTNNVTHNINQLFFVNSARGYAACDSGYCMKTINSGENWQLIWTGINYGLSSISFSNSDVGYIVGNKGGGTPFPSNLEILIKTTNQGINWTTVHQQQHAGYSYLYDVKFIDSLTGWIASDNNGVGHLLQTTNGGYNWFESYTLPGSYPSNVLGFTDIFLFDENKIWLGSFFGAVLTKVTPVGIQSTNTEVTHNFSLSQNYPNPFNPQTKIKFDVPSNPKGQTSIVKLVIYDLLGREVTTLVNEELKPGTYEADWDGSNFSSGVYFYKIISGDFVETKKMVLMK